MSVRSLLQIRSGNAGDFKRWSCRFSSICPLYTPDEDGRCIHKGDRLCRDFINALTTSES